jgi:ATP-binding cassette, subfamily B, multidrug efflux pump
MMVHEPEPEGKLFDGYLTRRLLGYARPYRASLGLALVVILLMAMTTSFMPVLLKTAIDNYLVPDDSGMDAAQRIGGLTRTGWLYFGMAVAAFLLRYFQSYLMAWAAERIIFDMRAAIYAKILRLPLRYMDRNPVGRLMTRVTSDVEAMQKMVTDGVVGLVADVFALFAIMGFMLYLSPHLAFTLFLILPVLLAVMAWINWNTRRAHRRVRSKQSSLNAYLQEMITGMLTVQLFNREQSVWRKFDERNRELREGWLESVRWVSYFFPSMEVLNAVSVGLLLVVAGAAILQGSDAVSIGVLVAFLAYIRDFFRPIEDLSEKSNIFQAAMASSERIFGLLDEPEEITDPLVPVSLTTFRGEIEFEHVWFAYQQEDWVLKDLSFRIAPGESVAIVGATGAGKTSIISLINRFYDVQRGCVRVDGQDVRSYRQVDLRRRIGVVIQDPFIFSGTIADNIQMHHPDVTREQVIEAARYVNAHRFIEALPDGYETHVQERGITLSTGQKQLLALARALVQNPDILLILDEATANVDTESEQLIQEALKRLMHGRTTILIAHRLSTIRGVDRIMVLRGGEKIEEGTHRALISHEGYYRRLYELLAHQPAGYAEAR